MTARIIVSGQEIFSPREWLRKDVLWASLMSPYSQQLNGWIDPGLTQRQQHNGNISRQKVYESLSDPESRALSYFNQGKNLAGLISSVVLFRSWMDRSGEGARVNTLSVQAKCVDQALGIRKSKPIYLEEEDAYDQCSHLSRQIIENPGDARRNQRRKLMASNIMLGLAQIEAKEWVQFSSQNNQHLLPTLHINDGGHPRSAGPRVDKLLPVFHSTIASDCYTALSS